MTPDEARALLAQARKNSPQPEHALPHMVDGKDLVDMLETIIETGEQ
ncbi:hypothetical protein [Corynebacterium auriscanis]|nr:hypothetical protein [Corynebacterium auriscanis]WJY73244.1 hypothetical protein CAURIC_08155 [Corynebacterium auriscanis]